VWQVLGKTTFRDFILGTPYEDILGRYVVNSAKIGSGRYGVIRKCIDAHSKLAYACKTIRKDRIEVRGRPRAYHPLARRGKDRIGLRGSRALLIT